MGSTQARSSTRTTTTRRSPSLNARALSIFNLSTSPQRDVRRLSHQRRQQSCIRHGACAAPSPSWRGRVAPTSR
eukprot:7325954-Pyramimonas_sp.AAC.1